MVLVAVRRSAIFSGSILSCHLLNYVIDDMTVLKLRTEHDNIRVCINFYVVSGWPVKQIIRADCLLRTVRIGRGELSISEFVSND